MILTMVFFSVILPAKNEAANLKLLIPELKKVLDLYSFEIIVVDDGSDDDTVQVVQAMDSSKVKVLSHQKSYGQSYALYSGAQVAQGKWLITLDADGQNNPQDLPQMIEKLHEGVHCICGVRTARKDSLSKKISSRLANKIRASLLKDHTPDTGCALKIMCREFFLTLPHFNHMHRYFPALIGFLGGKVLHVPVSHRQRNSGVSHYGFWDRLSVGIFDLIGVYWLGKRIKRPQFKSL